MNRHRPAFIEMGESAMWKLITGFAAFPFAVRAAAPLLAIGLVLLAVVVNAIGWGGLLAVLIGLRLAVFGVGALNRASDALCRGMDRRATDRLDRRSARLAARYPLRPDVERRRALSARELLDA